MFPFTLDSFSSFHTHGGKPRVYGLRMLRVKRRRCAARNSRLLLRFLRRKNSGENGNSNTSIHEVSNDPVLSLGCDHVAEMNYENPMRQEQIGTDCISAPLHGHFFNCVDESQTHDMFGMCCASNVVSLFDLFLFPFSLPSLLPSGRSKNWFSVSLS